MPIFVSKLLTGATVAIVLFFVLGLGTFYYLKSQVDFNQVTGEFFAEHKIYKESQLPSAGSPEYKELMAGLSQRGTEVAVQLGHKVVFLTLVPSLTLGALLGFSGIFPWCRPKHQF